MSEHQKPQSDILSAFQPVIKNYLQIVMIKSSRTQALNLWSLLIM